MKAIVLTLLVLLGLGVNAQTVISKTNVNGNGGNWSNSNTWEPSTSSNTSYTFVAPPNPSVEEIIILSGDVVTLSSNIDLSSANHPITLIVRGTLKLYKSGFPFNTVYKIDLPDGSAIVVEDGGKIDGDNKFVIIGGLVGTSTITAGGDDLYNHANGAQGQSPGDLTTSAGERIVVDQTGSSLPVELLSFESKTIENSIILNWQTATEINSEYFEIERSLDGINWESLGRLAAAGNSNTLREYVFMDNNPVAGDNYYRLLQMDFDGKYEYFGPVHQFISREDLVSDISLFPNPSTAGRITIKTNSPMKSGDMIELYDFSGRLLFSQQINETANQIHIGLPDYPKGIYYIRFIGSDRQISKKLIIQ